MSRKSKKRGKDCYFCLCSGGGKTKDHIIPRSWFTEGQRGKYQLVTAPCCRQCNEKLERAEDQFFTKVMLSGLVINETQKELREKVKESHLPSQDRCNGENAHRKAKNTKLFGDVMPPSLPALASLYPSSNMNIPLSEARLLLLAAEDIEQVAEKLTRGFFYRWYRQGYIRETHKIEVHHTLENMHQALGKQSPTKSERCDDVFEAYYYAASDVREPTGIYLFNLWNKIRLQVSVLPQGRREVKES